MPSATDLFACKDCLCLDARRRARAITRIYEDKLRPHGLRATQFSVLATLALKGPTRINDLAEFLVVDRTTLTRVASILRRDGLIDAAPSNDAREHHLRITAKGRRKAERAFRAWREAQAIAAREFAA